MKFKFHLLAISLASLFSVSFSGKLPAIKQFITSFDAIGPFEIGSEDYHMTGTITPRISVPNGKERLSVGVHGYSYSYFSTTNGHDINKSEAYELTFKLPLKTMLGKNGIDCLVEILNNEYETLYSFSFTLKPLVKNTISPGDYLSSYYSITDTIVDPDNYPRAIGEQIRFDGFIDYFNIDNYYRLDLDNITLTHFCLKDGLSAKASLHFDDYDNLFPYLDIKADVPYFDIPLAAVKIGNIVKFQIKNTLYVNPKTLDMSLNAKPDFVPTHYFYLPINKKTEMFNQKFTLKVSSFGLNQTAFSWDIRYTNNRGLIGDCHDSDYCIRGEM